MTETVASSAIGLGGIIGICLGAILGTLLVALGVHDYLVNPYLSESIHDRKEVALDVLLKRIPHIRHPARAPV